MRFSFTVILLLSTVFYPSLSVAKMEMEIFEIHYMDAEELEGAVKVALSKSGRVTVVKAANAIVVSDHSANIEMVKKLLARLDRRPVMFNITVEFVEERKLEELGLAVRWRIAGGGWKVGNITSGSSGATVRTDLLKFNGSQKQFIQIIERKQGKIFVGESVPFAEYVMQYGVNHGYISSGVKFKDAGTGFLVSAVAINGGKARINLKPEVSYYDHENKSFTVNQALTEIVMNIPGIVVLAGAENSDNNFSAHFLSGISSVKKESRMLMILTVLKK
ncbi:hypothetical protein MNBD_NITROSPINAE01-1736 [hydrothermal vent metagenome]|uniref:NolW-like domain-containing protein n=1 Tax=hydrothermal vent metagenome TaxID=652676 RepID=A0A3B1BFW9_9ZZZZ